ncbi:MAG: carbon storage regulator [Planctomycetota bacterium]
MLVLSRKNDQSVVIGGSNPVEHILKVTVLEIGQGRVRLGFEANEGVSVHRKEVWERIRNSRPHDPQTVSLEGTRLRRKEDKSGVLSGTGKGRSPKSVLDPV